MLKLKMKTKVILGLVVASLLLIGPPLAFVVLEDSTFMRTVLEDNQKEPPEKGRPIYDVTQPDVEEEEGNKGGAELDIQDMLDSGFTATEAQVMAALEAILGGSGEDALAKYFGWNTPVKIKSLTPLIVPAMCEEMRFGVNGDLSITQGIHELGWNYKAAGLSKRTSPAWNYYNAHGIKVGGSKPNEWWDGSGENVSTSEGVGGSIQIRDDFKSFKNFYNGFMYHGDFLTNSKRYKPGNFADATDPTEYAVALKNCGYYTDSSANYAKALNSIYKSANMDKYRDLYNQVVEYIARNGGASLTPDGRPVPEGEWLPSGNEGWGYFLKPEDQSYSGSDQADWGLRKHPISGKIKHHAGIDVGKGPKWTREQAFKPNIKLYAVKSGTITHAGRMGSYGNLVEITHSDSSVTRYAHMSKVDVSKGDKVNQGQHIGYMGSTGGSTGPHLHFETRKNTGKDSDYDPMTHFESVKYEGRLIVKPKGATTEVNPGNTGGGVQNPGSDSGGSNAGSNDLSTVGSLPINKQLITNTANYKPRDNRKVTHIVIHDTGNRNKGADAKMHANYFQTNTREVSAHYTVDDHSIYQSVAIKDQATHASSRDMNGKSIGIEMAVNSDGNFDTTLENTIALTKALMQKYNVPIENVIRHYDVNKKICPAMLIVDRPNGWADFKARLSGTAPPTTSGGSSSGSTNNGYVNNSTDKYKGFSWAKEHDINLSGLTNKRLSILAEGTKQLGKPYVLGATGPNTFDCSGFTSWCYKNGPGIDIPRVSGDQAASSKFKEVPIDKAKPGDLFWRPGHIGIFLKDKDSKSFIAMHSPQTGDVVKVAKYPKYDRGTVKFFQLK